MSKFKQSGGCQCGQVRYTLTKPPLTVYCCHCTECQKQSSSAFGISVRVETNAVEIEGETHTFNRPSTSGTMDCLFCPSCGTRLFHRRSTYGEHMNLKGGTFDDTSWLRPVGHIWVASQHEWLQLMPDDTLIYNRQPKSYDEMIARFKRVMEN